MEQEMNKIDAFQGEETVEVAKIINPKLSLAMAYVPPQEWEDLYDADIGFHRGTIFQALDKPFIGEEAIPNDRT